ncbi:hypothetical protein B0H14DRAFT_1458209 [Mycena olivaceomarginata]|nr:hypothetical protein B0H14DRAFT_1458209 [Mycena olivaceomarginata]
MGFEHFRTGKAGAPFRHNPGTTKTRRADASAADPKCATGGSYSAPALGSTVDSLSPLNVTWDSSLNCLPGSPSLVDVYLYTPGAALPIMHTRSGVPYSADSHSLALQPKWWNSTASCSLQLMVVPAGMLPFLSTIPAGPVFTATYAAPASGIPAAADLSGGSNSGATTVVTATALSGVSSHSLSPGEKAAAVLLPLLFVLLLTLAYLKISRAKGAAKRSAWSEKLDKRMSTISADWKSITPGGAKEGRPAVRHALAQQHLCVWGDHPQGGGGRACRDGREAAPRECGDQREGLAAHVVGLGRGRGRRRAAPAYACDAARAHVTRRVVCRRHAPRAPAWARRRCTATGVRRSIPPPPTTTLWRVRRRPFLLCLRRPGFRCLGIVGLARIALLRPRRTRATRTTPTRARDTDRACTQMPRRGAAGRGWKA